MKYAYRKVYISWGYLRKLLDGGVYKPIPMYHSLSTPQPLYTNKCQGTLVCIYEDIYYYR